VKSLETSTKYSKKFPENYIIGMLHIKSLLLNDKYTRANSLLQKIKILPYEGATEGRQLYRETLLMMALNEMEKNNFKKALTYIEVSRKWLERLGAGKAYEEDIDERLENWISNDINSKLQNKEVAETLLKKILSFTNNNIENEKPSSGNIISAWAYAATGDTARAKKYLEDIKIRNPDNKWSDWSMKLYNGQDYPVKGADTTDDNYRILQKWLLLRKP
jgi:tetratricopeptide (TPR) repeat protein